MGEDASNVKMADGSTLESVCRASASDGCMREGLDEIGRLLRIHGNGSWEVLTRCQCERAGCDCIREGVVTVGTLYGEFTVCQKCAAEKHMSMKED